MSDNKKNKEEILAAVEKWLDTPAKYTGVDYYGESEGMRADQEELRELDGIIRDIIDYRFCTDYSGWSYVQQTPLLSKCEYEYFYYPIVEKINGENMLDPKNLEVLDSGIDILSSHIESVASKISSWMRLKRMNLKDIDK